MARSKQIEKPGYTARLIGYLSLGMLAAAIGSALGRAWSPWWFLFGILGLVSSIGLGVLSQTRARNRRLKMVNELFLQSEKKLDKMLVVEESFGAISKAVRRIRSDAEESKTKDDKSRRKAKPLLNNPVTVTPLEWARKVTEKSIVGSVRNISGYGFSLAHDGLLQQGYVLLEIELENEEPIRLIADLLWCKVQSDGQFFSGGKFLELVTPVAAKIADKPVHVCD